MKAILLALLIIPGLLAAYAMIARPLLRKIPRFAAFYDQADGFWAKVWALSGNSLTVLWGYGLAAIGGAFQLIDMLAAALGDPSLDIKTQVTDALKDNPSLLGYALMGISVITIAARLRGLVSSKE
jgi:hypothetical protein